jgi:hypothetical protein
MNQRSACLFPADRDNTLAMSDSQTDKQTDPKPAAHNEPDFDYFNRHMVFGWWTLALFMALGVFLEYLHGFKVGYYLDVGNETRRLMFTLAHVHGTLFGVIHILFALTARFMPAKADNWQRIASPLLMAASVLMPGGFFLGGVWFYDGDPGLGIFLVPIGAVAIIIATVLTALGTGKVSGQD